MGPMLGDTLRAMTNIKPDDQTIILIEQLRDTFKDTATAVHNLVPSSPERSTALTQLRSSLMFAVQALVLASE